MNTLLLDRTEWDLALDTSGNIALAGESYSQVQDASSACRLFYNELWYGAPRGIRYFDEVLGKFQPTAVLKANLVKAALTVPGVTAAKVFLTAVDKREISGQVQITTATGTAIGPL